MSVAYSQQGSIAVLTVDNPPVNALSQAVRQGMVDGIERAIADPGVAAVVVIGKGKTFIAGADIREFGKPPQPPRLSVAIAALEASPKPVAAAIDDRKSTRLNSSHVAISYAVFCLKKKNKKHN